MLRLLKKPQWCCAMLYHIFYGLVSFCKLGYGMLYVTLLLMTSMQTVEEICKNRCGLSCTSWLILLFSFFMTLTQTAQKRNRALTINNKWLWTCSVENLHSWPTASTATSLLTRRATDERKTTCAITKTNLVSAVNRWPMNLSCCRFKYTSCVPAVPWIFKSLCFRCVSCTVLTLGFPYQQQ